MPRGTRTDQYQVTLTVAGRDCGKWTEQSGGGVDSEEAFDRESYGAPRVALGGQRTVENVKLNRTLYREDWEAELDKFLENQCGKGAATMSRQLLDPDGFAVGSPRVRTGVLKSFQLSDVDVAEGNDKGKMTVEISTDGI